MVANPPPVTNTVINKLNSSSSCPYIVEGDEEAVVLHSGHAIVKDGGRVKVLQDGYAVINRAGHAVVGSGGLARVFDGGYAIADTDGRLVVMSGGRAAVLHGGWADILRHGRGKVACGGFARVFLGGWADVDPDGTAYLIEPGAVRRVMKDDGYLVEVAVGSNVQAVDFEAMPAGHKVQSLSGRI